MKAPAYFPYSKKGKHNMPETLTHISTELEEQYKAIDNALKEITPIISKLARWKINRMGNPECDGMRFEFHADVLEIFYANIKDEILGYMSAIETIYSDDFNPYNSTPNENGNENENDDIDNLPF